MDGLSVKVRGQSLCLPKCLRPPACFVVLGLRCLTLAKPPLLSFFPHRCSVPTTPPSPWTACSASWRWVEGYRSLKGACLPVCMHLHRSDLLCCNGRCLHTTTTTTLQCGSVQLHCSTGSACAHSSLRHGACSLLLR